MKTCFSSLALLAALVTAAPAQILAQTVASAANSSASRLGQMVLDPIPDQSLADNTSSVPSSRLGGILLAQIPQQSPIRPGQNPNTIMPGGARTNRPLANRLPSPSPAPSAPAGSVAPPQQPAISAAQPAPMPAPQAQPSETPAPDASGDDELVDLQFVNVPMPQILLEYEDLTGKKVIRDINVEAVTFTIETTGKLPKKKAIEFMEKSLLLNGYGFLPAGEDFVKFLNFAALKPGPERPLIMKQDELPTNNEMVVTYIQPLQYLEADDLKKTLGELVPLHTFGVVTPLPNSRGVAITENSNTIRYILELLKTLDVEPSRTEKRSFQLERASVEDVSKALADILDLEGKGSSGSGGSSGKSHTTPPQTGQPAAPAIPNQPGTQPAATARAGVYGTGPQATAIPPKIIPIPRTNKLLVIARPSDLDYIGTLIEELDGAADVRSFITRPLKYLAAHDLLPIIKDAISRGMDEGGGSGSGGSSGSIIGNNTGTNNNNTNRTGDFGTGNRSGGLGSNSSGFGSNSSGMGGSSSFGNSGGGGLQSLRQAGAPQSLVVGKTLLIADPTANVIFASGPPEHLRILEELLDELDKRPKSVMLSVVIGQMELQDKNEYGVDYIFHPNTVKFSKYNGTFAGSAGSPAAIQDINAVTGISSFKNVVNNLSIFGTINDQVSVALNALQTDSRFKVLSRPTLYTMNNQPASIETGVKIPVPTSSVSSYNSGVDPNGVNNNGFVSNIQYQDVSLRLDVVPLINSDEDLTLQVKQINAEVGETVTVGNNKIPQISQQGIETTVMVKNNATVLLGGLIREDVNKSRTGIPILRDIPLIKYLASSTTDNKKRRELLIFIQPRIIDGNGDTPTTYQDSAGASPLGEDARRFMTQERTNPDLDTKTVHRNKVWTLLHKLFE